jgi:hypothetical protein
VKKAPRVETEYGHTGNTTVSIVVAVPWDEEYASAIRSFADPSTAAEFAAQLQAALDWRPLRGGGGSDR